MNFQFILLLSTGVILSYLGAAFIYKYGTNLYLIDIPKTRSSHCIPTPKCGGIGFIIAFILFIYVK